VVVVKPDQRKFASQRANIETPVPPYYLFVLIAIILASKLLLSTFHIPSQHFHSINLRETKQTVKNHSPH